jgi:hypothetical protein
VETYREQVVDEGVDVAVVHVPQSQEEAVQLKGKPRERQDMEP